MRPRVAVVGLGGIGSHIALSLADRGADVTGFDGHRPPHEIGSSHGESRMIREAYAEGPQYVPLVRRAWTLWQELGRRAGEALLFPTGGVHIARPGSAYLTSVRTVAQEFGVELDVLGRDDAAIFAPPPGAVALREGRAGWIAVERAVAAPLRLAADAGARLCFGRPVIGLGRDGAKLSVITAAGNQRFDRVVVSAGNWASTLLAELAPVLELERQSLVWFEPPRRPPTTIWFGEYGPDRFVYGFPPDRHGLKAAIHHEGLTVRLGTVDLSVSESEMQAVQTAANTLLATPLGAARRSRVCLYTNTPDKDFALGPLPGDERIIVASACSGHGFKFAPAIGEAVAALALGDLPHVNVEAFALTRPALGLAG